MTEEFSQFREMQASGRTATEAYQAAKLQQRGELFSLRMLRIVYGLSLPDAKRVSGTMEKISQPQIPVVGERVYWEGWDTIDGQWIVEATVDDVCGGNVHVVGHRKFLVPGFKEVPPSGALDQIPESYFAKSLVDRLEESKAFVNELAQV